MDALSQHLHDLLRTKLSLAWTSTRNESLFKIPPVISLSELQGAKLVGNYNKLIKSGCYNII